MSTVAAPPVGELHGVTRKFDGCGWSNPDAPCGPIVGTVLVDPGVLTTDPNGRKARQGKLRVPVCAEYRDSLRLVSDEATLRAQDGVRAREWRARQCHFFDGRTFQVGSSQRRGSWQE